MATPKIFVSSTCYDLHEIRSSLKSYMTEFGCDSILSEFGDIFYDPAAHVQDACVDSIKQSDLFILIIGNSYGSIYYNNVNNDTPDSVTLKEFKKALSLKIPKMIFINKFVSYDYKNYRKFLEEKYTEYYSKNKVTDEQKESINASIKQELDSKYHFSQKSYKYVFHFLDSINELELNNSYFEFENSDDVKLNIKKQFAGYLYNALKHTQDKMIDKIGVEKKTLERLEQFEKILTSLADGIKESSEQKIINLDKFINRTEISEFSELRDKFDESINDVLYKFVQSDYYNSEDDYVAKRLLFLEDLQSQDGYNKILNWVKSLNDFINTYKWTKSVSSEIVFKDFKCQINKEYSEIPMYSLEILSALYDTESNKDSFIKSVQSKFIQLEKQSSSAAVNLASHISVAQANLKSDDIPF